MGSHIFLSPKKFTGPELGPELGPWFCQHPLFGLLYNYVFKIKALYVHRWAICGDL